MPTVRAEDCETMNPRLTLVHDPEVEVAFTLPPEWKPIALDDSLMSGFRTSSPVIKGSYQLNDFVAVGTIQTSARHSRCSSRAVARLKRSDDGANWRLNYRLEMTPEGDSAVRMGVAFPPSFSDVDAVTVSRAEPVWQHDLQDGTRQLDLLLNRSEGPTSVVVQFETTLAEPNQAEWELPLPVPLHSKAHETLIAIDPDTIWFPKTGREIGPGELAKWESDSGEEFPSLRTPFVVVGTTIEFQRTVAASEVREPSIRLLDQRMWLHRDGRRSGIAQMFVSSMRGDLELQVPDRVSITSIFLNDRALALSEAIVGLLKVPMIDVGVESVLTITWQDEEQDVGLRLSTSEPFLWPRNVPVERSLVAIVPDEPTTISAKSGLTPIGSLDRNLDVLETLLDRHSALGIDTRAAIANRCLIDQLQRQIKERLPKEFQRGQELVRKQFSRWSEFVGRINQLERVPDSPTISWYARLFEEPTIESEYSILGRTSRNATVSIRQFDWRAWKSVGAALLSLILVLMLRRTIRIEWSGWLNLHVAFSWLLLATFWWLCLTPSALGPCLLAIAMAKAVSQYRPAKSPA